MSQLRSTFLRLNHINLSRGLLLIINYPLSSDMVRYSDKQELLSDLEVAISATLIVETLLQQEFAADTDSNDESDDEMDDIDLRLGEYPNYSDNL